MIPQIVEQISRGRTVFRLPFKDDLSQEDIGLLKDQFCKLGERYVLLFLRDLQPDFKRPFKTIKWIDERDDQTGICSYIHHRHSKIQGASEVELTMSLNGENQLSEMFLVFHKVVQPPQYVIDALLKQTKHDEKRQKIQKSAKKRQPIEIAFKLHNSGSITAIDGNCVLFAYLPTEKETHLKFLIQARYQTTSGREGIQSPSENPWNRWLVQETAKFLPEILEQLKASDLLEPGFFNVLPLKGEVENEFKLIAEALQKAMKEGEFVPTQCGEYAKAENVFYPHRESLSELIESSWLYPKSSWLHPDVGLSGRVFSVMKEAGVKEINVGQVLNWLEQRDCNWFKTKSNERLRSLYNYLNSQQSELERIKKLPLVRLENGRHVCASEAFFPPETDEARKEIAPFLDELPILQSALLEGEEGNDIKGFLGKFKLGVRGLEPQEMVDKWILPQYSRCDKPCKEQNRLHVHYIFKVWNKFLGYQYLREKISETPILRSYRGIQPETFSFVKPDDAYLPEAYTGDTHLETYFSVSDNDVWFVDGGYLDGNSNAKEWFKFLKAIGAMDTPRVDKIEVVGNKAECKKRSIEYQESRKPFEDGEFKDVPRKGDQYFDGYIVDPCWVGLSQILTQIKKRNGVNLSCSIWNLVIKTIKPLSPEKQRGQKASDRDAFFQGAYCWLPRSKRNEKTEEFESLFYRDLIDTNWIPDEEGTPRQPSELHAPTDENRKLLGGSVVYLHPDFDVSTQPAQWLAKKLKIDLKANTKSVMKSLQTLSGTEASVKDVEPLYLFLDRQYDLRSEEFKKLPLIFTPNLESHWWRVDEVFWEDKSEVLDSDHRCLKAHYPANLRSFFITLDVSEQASQRDYACRIQEITTIEQAENEEVRERVRRLYKCLIPLRKHEWEVIYDDKCWLGKEGDAWGFFTRQELVLKDHPYIGEIFEGKVPFWTFDDDLSSLASALQIEVCSQAQVEFHSEGDQEEDPDWSEKVRNLRLYIHAFLNSPGLCEKREKEKSAEVLNQVSVCRVQELKVTYTLKGISAPDLNPRQSFLDVTDQQAKLWLGLEVDKSEYAELIGDALQDHFGAKDLGRFVEDLLTPTKEQDRVLSNWKRKGLDTKFLDEYPKDDEEKRIEFLDEKLPDEPQSGDADFAADESNMRTPPDNEMPKTDDEDNDSSVAGNESETHFSRIRRDDSRTGQPRIETSIDSETTEIDRSVSDTPFSTYIDSRITQNVNEEFRPEKSTVNEASETESKDSHSVTPPTIRTNRQRGHSLSTSGRKSSRGHSNSGGSGGGESDEHRELKERLASNTFELGAELELVEVEYTFESGDRVDILLKDGSENPVTVEVEIGFSSGSGRYVGVWQAVKYQHLAAVKYEMPCEQVRSILAAPEIPEDVKKKCEELGIEPVEISQQ
ncbi:hypothetical protein F4055_10675 [Candidatus Poribacteria bacterium]|nr:hypothetical protein [Candidatus Poribacteria bacterium]